MKRDHCNYIHFISVQRATGLCVILIIAPCIKYSYEPYFSSAAWSAKQEAKGHSAVGDGAGR